MKTIVIIMSMLWVWSASAGIWSQGSKADKMAFLNQSLPILLKTENKALVPNSVQIHFSKLFGTAKILDSLSLKFNFDDPDVRVVTFVATDEASQKEYKGWLYLWTFNGKIPGSQELQELEDFTRIDRNSVVKSSTEFSNGPEVFFILEFGKNRFHFKSEDK